MMLQDIQAQMGEIFRNMVERAVGSVPQLLVGAVLIILALIVAKGVERLLRVVMVRTRFDALVRRSGVDNWLSRIGVRQSLDDVVPRVVYFILLFLFAREAADALGLTAISEAIGSVIAYLPSLISAFLILLVGSAVAQVAGKAVAEAGRGAGMEFAPLLGKLLTGVLLFVLVVMALGELEVQTLLVRELAVILVGGGVFAFALSFGLGSRDISRNILAGLYIRKIIRVGDEIEVADRRGRVEAITPTQTILREGERSVILSNGVFLDSVTSR
ncbi:MAG: mechanosensitive ion channel domain-containing protein [Gemmatimonadota bacterium]